MNQRVACVTKLLSYVALKMVSFYNSEVNGTLPLFLPICMGTRGRVLRRWCVERQRCLCKTRDKPSQCLMCNCRHMQCPMHTRATLHWQHNCWQTGSTARSPCMPLSAELQAKSLEKHRDWKTMEASSTAASYWPTAVGPVWSWM